MSASETLKALFIGVPIVAGLFWFAGWALAGAYLPEAQGLIGVVAAIAGVTFGIKRI